MLSATISLGRGAGEGAAKRWQTATRQADQLIAQAAAARILEAMKRAYVITPKAPQPLARADQLPKMGNR